MFLIIYILLTCFCFSWVKLYLFVWCDIFKVHVFVRFQWKPLLPLCFGNLSCSALHLWCARRKSGPVHVVVFSVCNYRPCILLIVFFHWKIIKMHIIEISHTDSGGFTLQRDQGKFFNQNCLIKPSLIPEEQTN